MPEPTALNPAAHATAQDPEIFTALQLWLYSGPDGTLLMHVSKEHSGARPRNANVPAPSSVQDHSTGAPPKGTAHEAKHVPSTAMPAQLSTTLATILLGHSIAVQVGRPPCNVLSARHVKERATPSNPEAQEATQLSLVPAPVQLWRTSGPVGKLNSQGTGSHCGSSPCKSTALLTASQEHCHRCDFEPVANLKPGPQPTVHPAPKATPPQVFTRPEVRGTVLGQTLGVHVGGDPCTKPEGEHAKLAGVPEYPSPHATEQLCPVVSSAHLPGTARSEPEGAPSVQRRGWQVGGAPAKEPLAAQA
mmetsp:Transcript_90927/g.293563  ORF Transcript_90927/g.293563 Transcript_90927/m.293563 type:complete len:304 (+) Transcript_90927:1555-2466(+)